MVRNEFVDSAGRAFSYGSVQSSCAGNQFAPLVDGVFSVLAPTTACTFYASLNRSTNLGNGTTFSYRSENYGLNSTIPTTPGDYTWTIPTTTATIRVVDGDGNDIDINEVRASMNNSTTGPLAYTIPGPAGCTPASISNFNTSINNPITGTYELDVLQHPTIAVSVTLTDGTTLTQTINTTTGPTNIELIAVGDPTWIVSGTGVFSDADGVDDFTESQAPNNGDGNDDGIKDAQQQNVPFPSTSPTKSYVTIRGAGWHHGEQRGDHRRGRGPGQQAAALDPPTAELHPARRTRRLPDHRPHSRSDRHARDLLRQRDRRHWLGEVPVGVSGSRCRPPLSRPSPATGSNSHSPMATSATTTASPMERHPPILAVSPRSSRSSGLLSRRATDEIRVVEDSPINVRSADQ